MPFLRLERRGPGLRILWEAAGSTSTVMALNSPYLAAENSVMDRRSRGLHRLIVASPLLLLLAVAVVGRRQPRAYVHPAGTPDYDRKVLAYRDRVRTVDALGRNGRVPTLAESEAEGRRWAAGFDSGALVPLEPPVYEDHLRESVRGEVLRDGLQVSVDLSLGAENRLAHGDAPGAARDALLAAQIANGLRGFELQAYLLALLAQRRAIGILDHAWPSLALPARDGLRPPLAALLIGPVEVDRLAASERRRYDDYRRRRGIPATVEIGTLDQTPFSDPQLESARRSARQSDDRLHRLIAAGPRSG